ncbi:MAG: acetylornithine transaminase [Armatimonadetes bacterium]|nr:acetylornithine transaminase [Armatimonadota bacterium]
MIDTHSAQQLDDLHVMKTYRRFPALFERGNGCLLWDENGRVYLDFLAGIGVCQLGHAHPAVTEAITRQASRLVHGSNLLLTDPVPRLAAKLCAISGMDRVFFSVCGASAIETALKIAKKHGLSKRRNGDYKVLALDNSFHGRTLGALTLTGQIKYQDDFQPLIPGISYVKPNDLDALKAAFDDSVAAIFIEPIQGEGGVVPISREFLAEARTLCDRHGALLVFDEIQTGMGRTGTWFHFQQHGVVPDVMAIAKGLGNGMPIGACLARGEAAEVLQPGNHGSTFGGNPLMCAAGLAVIETIESQGVIANAKRVGDSLRSQLTAIGGPIAEVRGAGLMIGIRLNQPIARDVVQKCFERGLVANATSEDTLRLLPPLILTEAQAEQGVAILKSALAGETSEAVEAVAQTPEAYHDVLAMEDLSGSQAEEVLALAARLKNRRKFAPEPVVSVEGRTIALVFEKPSLRTRVSFEAAIQELGGHAVYLSKADIGMGSREAIKDVASNLGGWCAAVVARLYWQRHLHELAHYCDSPVINALTEMEHPCQALADMLTVREAFGGQTVPITYVGDANNVARSLAKLAVMLGYPMTICGPKNFQLEETEGVRQTESIEEGLTGAKVVYTDVWVSMGDEHEQEHRLKVFEPYQVDSRVMAMAEKDAIFLHCLPARRGFEVTDDVIDGAQSRVVQQAENRLHAQKALLAKVLGLAQ